MRTIRRLCVILLAATLYSCNFFVPAGIPSPDLSPSASPSQTVTQFHTPAGTLAPIPSPTPRPKAERVVIISIDGLRPDGLLRANIPRISGLINGGASSFSARTILPSGTLPAHASMVSGRCPSKHGILWNDLIPSNGYLEGPTVFSVAKDAGLRTVMVVGKEKLLTLARPGTVDDFRFVNGSDEQIVQAALEEAAPGFGILFVHLILPDSLGHSVGWMSPDYIKVIARDDTAVGTLVDGLRAGGLLEGTLIILTADHGGHDQTHGTYLEEDMTIPWIVYGPGVLAGVPIEVPVSIMDTAATSIWELGLAVPADWDGRPVVEAFGLQADLLPVPTAAAVRCGI
jgi:predicted AlkP superfamily pyrophosphatase or phosphodiesterase